MTKTLSEYVEGLSHETLIQCIREYESWRENARQFDEESALFRCAKEYYAEGFDRSACFVVIREINRRCALMWVKKMG